MTEFEAGSLEADLAITIVSLLQGENGRLKLSQLESAFRDLVREIFCVVMW